MGPHWTPGCRLHRRRRLQRGDLILPVRLPSGAGRWPRLVHFLNNPDTWHKVDLVRHRDTAAPGGWAYEAI
ncbi:hypothetical protein E4K10_01650 [Streptomyces sp. T1317-0309]|nr:hypothetical protein E4K10_01650 [Streptomyces sp. T1317-0309]